MQIYNYNKMSLLYPRVILILYYQVQWYSPILIKSYSNPEPLRYVNIVQTDNGDMQISENISIVKWDYTNHDNVEQFNNRDTQIFNDEPPVLCVQFNYVSITPTQCSYVQPQRTI